MPLDQTDAQLRQMQQDMLLERPKTLNENFRTMLGPVLNKAHPANVERLLPIVLQFSKMKTQESRRKYALEGFRQAEDKAGFLQEGVLGGFIDPPIANVLLRGFASQQRSAAGDISPFDIDTFESLKAHGAGDQAKAMAIRALLAKQLTQGQYNTITAESKLQESAAERAEAGLALLSPDENLRNQAIIEAKKEAGDTGEDFEKVTLSRLSAFFRNQTGKRFQDLANTFDLVQTAGTDKENIKAAKIAVMDLLKSQNVQGVLGPAFTSTIDKIAKLLRVEVKGDEVTLEQALERAGKETEIAETPGTPFTALGLPSLQEGIADPLLRGAFGVDTAMLQSDLSSVSQPSFEPPPLLEAGLGPPGGFDNLQTLSPGSVSGPRDIPADVLMRELQGLDLANSPIANILRQLISKEALTPKPQTRVEDQGFGQDAFRQHFTPRR